MPPSGVPESLPDSCKRNAPFAVSNYNDPLYRFVKAMRYSPPAISPFSSPRRASQDKRALTRLVMVASPRELWSIWDSSSQGTESNGPDTSTPSRSDVRRILTFHTNHPTSNLGSHAKTVVDKKNGLNLPWDSYDDEC